MADRVIYYIPVFPTIHKEIIKSSTRYNHALALANQTDESVLITRDHAPTEIVSEFTEYHCLGGGTMSKQVRESRSIVSQYEADRDLRLVTSFNYVPALTGYLSDMTWVVDALDNPRQYVLHEGTSYINYLINPFLRWIIDQADIVVHTPHPSTPDKYGNEQRYVRNGAPVFLVDSELNEKRFERNRRRMVWSGVKEGIDIVLDALEQMSEPIPFDIYGPVEKDFERELTDRGFSDLVNCHGAVKNSIILSVLDEYTFGLCILPPRQDNVYAYPIKVGEYIANGVIPVMSDFPGMRDMVRGAGTYTSPRPDELAQILDRLNALGVDELRTLSSEAVERSRAISWEEERNWFAKQVLDSHNK